MKQLPTLIAAALCAAASLHHQARAATPPEPLTLKVTPERDLVYRKGPREVVVQVEVEARRPDHANHSPLNLAFVLDRSGSMGGPKIEKARQAACAAVDKMADDDIFSLVIYDQEIELLVPPGKVGSSANRERIKAQIDRIRARGSTALYGGVQLGAEQVRKHLADERVNRIILLSDGLANVGPSTPHELAGLGAKLREEGLSVTTIGVGDDFNENLMTALAEASRANYYYVRDAEKLPGIFAEELGAVCARMASNVTIRIEVPAGTRLREIIGRPELKCDERGAKIELPEMFGAERRIYHLRCALDDAAAADALPVAHVALNYEDTASHHALAQDARATVHLADDPAAADKSVRDEVAQQVAIVGNRLDKEKAAWLLDHNRPEEAAQVLQFRANSNAALPAPQQIPNVSSENANLNAWATELQKNGALTKSAQKVLKYDNYQDRASIPRVPTAAK